MGCCGGDIKRKVRSVQTVQSAERSQKTITVRRISSKINSATPIPIQRQYVIPRQACPKCGNPTMLVHIAGRERQQCTNINCKLIIQ